MFLNLKVNVKRELSQFVEPSRVLTEPADLICYSYDATRMESIPSAVVKVRSAQEVSNLLRFTNNHEIPVTPRGAATGLSGGSIPLNGGIVIDMTLMDGILDIDVDNLRVTVEPGVVTNSVNVALARFGLIFPPDPSSHLASTIGGNIAENAGGLRGLKYGVTGDYVYGVEVVLPDGTVVKTTKDEQTSLGGFDLIRLLVGSEGTFGVITQAILDVRPIPAARKSALAIFDDLKQASSAVNEIIGSRVIPATLEIIDNVTIRAVEEFLRIGLPMDAGAVLLIEVDGDEDSVQWEFDRATAAIKKSGSSDLKIAEDDSERENLWAARRAALSALSRVKPSTILEDATVPRSKLADLVSAVEKISKKHDLIIGDFGHAGDGNMHPTILTDLRIEEEARKVEMAVEEIFRATIELGGTLSGEHGIGFAKAKYIPLEFTDSDIEVMRRIKLALDPNNILNPGKVLL
ncbi:MAG: FAD-binding protein [Actinobacteria bacterium]|nr:FAD-binding protein [Actinomycetota bacterium]